MTDLTLRQINDLKRAAELNITSVVSNILEKFKEDTGIVHAEHSVYVNMDYSHEMGQKYAEALVRNVEIDMKVFD